MASFQIFFSTFLLLFFFLFLLFLPHTARSQTTCKPSTCGGSRSPPIKFPFQLNNTQTKVCGYPKFNLSCNNIGQTIVTLPYSGDFVVQDINYLCQAMFITDPDNCFAKRYLQNFTLSGSPFQLEPTGNFTFYNCSSNDNLFGIGPIPCVSGHNYSVWMTPSFIGENFPIPDSCSLMMSAMLPFSSPEWVRLVWSEPSCEDCEERCGDCGLESNTSLDVGCILKEENQGIQKEEQDGFEIPSFYLSMGLGFITGFWIFWGSLLLNRSWRHTYIRFLDNMNDKIYVMVAVGANKLRRKFQSQQPLEVKGRQ
ncbi:putative RING-H2 finger protein ATL21A [Fagus crenata]